MNTNRRPIAIVIIACLYIAVGAAGFIFHFRESLADPRDGVWIELTEFLAIGAGIFLLRGRNWARWLALAWIVFHVVLSAFGPVRELVMHALICAAIAWLLFRPDASQFFRDNSATQT